MSYSWAAYGDFTLPSEGRGSLAARVKPWVTSAESFREDGFFDDWVYSAAMLRYTAVFQEPYDEKREMLMEMLVAIAEAGGAGELVAVGFEDGGPDAGERWTIKAGKVVAKKIGSAGAKKARAHAAYGSIVAKWEGAFPELNAKPPPKPLSPWQARALERLESFPAAAVFEVATALNVIVSQTKKKTVTLTMLAETPERLLALFRDGEPSLDERTDGSWRSVGLLGYLERLDAAQALAFAEEILAAPEDAEFTPAAWGLLARVGDAHQLERAAARAFDAQPDLVYGLASNRRAGPRWIERLFCRWCDAETAPEELAKSLFMTLQRGAPVFTDRGEIASLVRAMSGPRNTTYPCLVFERYAMPHIPGFSLSEETLLWLRRGSMNAERLAEIRGALGMT